MGAIIAPPVPGFYNNPATIAALVDSSIDRVLDLLGVPDEKVRRWGGPKPGNMPDTRARRQPLREPTTGPETEL
jgi:hypothetical protein